MASTFSSSPSWRRSFWLVRSAFWKFSSSMAFWMLARSMTFQPCLKNSALQAFVWVAPRSRCLERGRSRDGS